MRPTLRGRRWYLGVGAIFAGALFAAPASRAFANDSGNVFDVRSPDDDDKDDADFQKQVKEVEKGLNDLLTVDEDKKVHVKKELAEGLPMPAPQIERMLQMSVKVGDDGKIRLRNPEQIRPFLPQIQAFLKSGGAGKLKELSKKSPEERKAEMEKLMKEQGLPGLPGGGGERGGDGGERRSRRETPSAPPAPPAPPAHHESGALEDRVARLEKAIDHIERMVKEMAERGGAPGPRARSGGEPQGPQWHQESWGWRAEPGQGPTRERNGPREGTRERAPRAESRDNGARENGRENGLEEGMRQAERAFEKARAEFEKRIAELRDRFRNGGDDEREDRGSRRGTRHRDEQDDEDEAPPRRSRSMPNDENHRMPNDEHHRNVPRGHQDKDEDDDQDMSLQDLGAGARDVFAGLRKVGQVMTREDWEMITRMLGRLAKSIKPEDLQDQGALMQKIQEAVDPADMPRFLEIAGKVLGSPEGQAMQKRLDSTLRRVEKLQGEDGFGQGQGLKGLQSLLQGRGKKAPATKQNEKHRTDEKHRAEEKHLTEAAPSNPTRPATARLY